MQSKFSRVKSFLKCFLSHSVWDNQERRKTVHFSLDSEPSVKELLSSSHQSAATQEEDISRDNAVCDFIAPTVCSLCSDSMASVSHSSHLLHSRFLLALLHLHCTPSLIKAIFSSLESNHSVLIREFRKEQWLTQRLLILCSILTKAARVDDGGISVHPEFTANLIESMLLLIKCDTAEMKSISVFLSDYIKVRGQGQGGGGVLLSECIKN